MKIIDLAFVVFNKERLLDTHNGNRMCERAVSESRPLIASLQSYQQEQVGIVTG
jgi:hypothetical protein